MKARQNRSTFQLIYYMQNERGRVALTTGAIRPLPLEEGEELISVPLGGSRKDCRSCYPGKESMHQIRGKCIRDASNRRNLLPFRHCLRQC